MTLLFQCRPSRCGRVLLRCLLLWATLVCAPAVLAQEARLPDYQVKAAFLYNFGKFVEWPDGVFAATNAPLVIGVLGTDPFHGDLERLAANQHINGHPIVVRPIKTDSDLNKCHILFLATLEKAEVRDALKTLDGASVLTVSETDNFLAAGGMIQFLIENRKVHFAINNEAARHAGLKTSSKLLALARPADKRGGCQK